MKIAGPGRSQKRDSPCRGVNSCPDSLTNPDNRVLAALDQSGLPAFLPHSGKLAHQVMSQRAHGLERAPARTNDSPTTLRACLSARGPGLLHRGVPPQASPIQDIPEQGVSHSIWPAPALACTSGRTSPFPYMCSNVSQIEQFVKFFGRSPFLILRVIVAGQAACRFHTMTVFPAAIASWRPSGDQARLCTALPGWTGIVSTGSWARTVSQSEHEPSLLPLAR